ncbi:MAG TPA: hypothetical protein VHM94_02645 [Acidimicrobiia bacterium]|jgi:hypothetical protein|nr:hypothetical protein [Acidimicrobiia bacterium]
MTWLAVVLLGIGMCDAIAAGLGGEPRSTIRIAIGAVAGGVASLLAALLVGLELPPALAAAGLVAAGSAGWNLLRLPASPSAVLPSSRAWAALAVLGASLMLTLVLGAVWAAASADSPGLVVIGSVAALAVPANGVVRTVLAASGTEFRRSEQTLRGGRVIGVVERLLIFTLALAGQLTAAVVVATAKGILRFPELQAARERAIEVVGEGRHAADGPSQVDIITEYFLVGSLTSWLLAVVLGLAASS